MLWTNYIHHLITYTKNKNNTKLSERILNGCETITNVNYQDTILHLEKSLSLAKLSALNLTDDTFETGYFNLGQAKKNRRLKRFY
jgi:hypothetical protein